MDFFAIATETLKPLVHQMAKTKRIWEIRINGNLYQTTNFNEAYKFACMFEGKILSREWIGEDFSLQVG